MLARNQKQNLMWGILLILFGVTALIGEMFSFAAISWSIIFFIAGLFSIVLFWQERSNWAYLIPTYVFWIIGIFIAFIFWNIINDEAIAVFVLWGIALPFLIGYLRNRQNWGLLIPAYVLIMVGGLVGMIGLGILNDLLIPAYVMLAIAAPFFVVYFQNTKNWWALIPGGIMGVIALGFLLASPSVRFIVPVLLVLVGIWILIRQFVKR